MVLIIEFTHTHD